jgi:hypothetical protein
MLNSKYPKDEKNVNMPVAGNYRGTFERTMEGKGLMLVWIVILWLLIVGCGSFLEWSVRKPVWRVCFSQRHGKHSRRDVHRRRRSHN